MSWVDRFLRRGGEAGGGDRSMAATSMPGRVEAEFLDADGWRSVTFNVIGSRVSDTLNDLAAELAPRLEDGSPADLSTALVLVPPGYPAGDPSRRLHRPPHPLWVRLGECAVTGSLHLPPGSVGSAYLLRRQHQFFVLTDAILTRPVPGGREERRVPVLLVNLQQVSSLRDTPEPEAVPGFEAPPA